MPTITSPIQVGRFNLKNRLVLAPLTRLRNSPLPDAAPPNYAATYYAQRTNDGGLIISEATAVHPEAYGAERSPGIFNEQQISAWRNVTDAIHAKNGIVVCQLWALGRVASPKVVDRVVGPSACTFNKNGEPVQITEMTEDDIDRFVDHFRQGALNALKAGFDGVEIHGANGYLIDQFLQPCTNHRTDQYGGSIENRLRFPLRVLNAVSEAVGADRTGIRLSPWSDYQLPERGEDDPLETFIPATKAMLAAQPDLAYIHVIEPRIVGAIFDADDSAANPHSSLPLRELVDKSPHTKFIAAGGFKPETAEETIEKYGGLVAFGRYYIANPDLLDRIVKKEELTPYDRSTFYTPGVVGYIDYPTYNEAQVQA